MIFTSFTEPFTSGVVDKQMDNLLEKLKNVPHYEGGLEFKKETDPEWIAKAGIYHSRISGWYKGKPESRRSLIRVGVNVFANKGTFSVDLSLRWESGNWGYEVEDDPHEYVFVNQELEIVERSYLWTDEEPPENLVEPKPLGKVLTEESIRWAMDEVAEYLRSCALMNDIDHYSPESQSLTFTTYVE